MADGVLEAGRAMLDAGNVDGAMRAAKQALQADPNDFDALDLLTQVQMEIGDYNGASETNEQLLRLNPQHTQAHVTRVLIPMRRGHYEPSKRALEAFRLARPMAIYEHRYLLALWEYQFGSPAKSIALLREILTEQPGDTGLQRMLGLAEYEARNPFRAGDAMSRVLSQHANDAAAQRVMAFVRFREFAFGDARALAKGARALDPTEKPLRWVNWGSYLALFPPFFAGHGLQWVTAKIAAIAGPVAGHAANVVWVILAIWGVVYAAGQNQAEPFLPHWQGLLVLGFLLATAWALIVHYVLGEDWNPDPYANTQTRVRLDDY